MQDGTMLEDTESSQQLITQLELQTVWLLWENWIRQQIKDTGLAQHLGGDANLTNVGPHWLGVEWSYQSKIWRNQK